MTDGLGVVELEGLAEEPALTPNAAAVRAAGGEVDSARAAESIDCSWDDDLLPALGPAFAPAPWFAPEESSEPAGWSLPPGYDEP